MRKKVQPEASINTKRLFFLDVARDLWPPKICIQLSNCGSVTVDRKL